MSNDECEKIKSLRHRAVVPCWVSQLKYDSMWLDGFQDARCWKLNNELHWVAVVLVVQTGVDTRQDALDHCWSEEVLKLHLGQGPVPPVFRRDRLSYIIIYTKCFCSWSTWMAIKLFRGRVVSSWNKHREREWLHTVVFPGEKQNTYNLWCMIFRKLWGSRIVKSWSRQASNDWASEGYCGLATSQRKLSVKSSLNRDEAKHGHITIFSFQLFNFRGVPQHLRKGFINFFFVARNVTWTRPMPLNSPALGPVFWQKKIFWILSQLASGGKGSWAGEFLVQKKSHHFSRWIVPYTQKLSTSELANKSTRLPLLDPHGSFVSSINLIPETDRYFWRFFSIQHPSCWFVVGLFFCVS